MRLARAHARARLRARAASESRDFARAFAQRDRLVVSLLRISRFDFKGSIAESRRDIRRDWAFTSYLPGATEEVATEDASAIDSSGSRNPREISKVLLPTE